MDTQNLSGTEEPLIKVKWNESEEYSGGSGNALDIMEIVQLVYSPSWNNWKFNRYCCVFES